MKKTAICLMLGASLPMLAGCISQPVRLTAVGPAPALGVSDSKGKGRLQVFTETREYVDEDVYYFPHSGYQIDTPDGKHFKYVWNHTSHEDDTPTVVTLPAGQYLVDAQAEFCGRVRIPVVVKSNETTKVVLQPGWTPGRNASSSDLVQSPRGYFIGWRAELSQNR